MKGQENEGKPSDTPRTDGFWRNGYADAYDMRECSIELERELASANARIEELEIAGRRLFDSTINFSIYREVAQARDSWLKAINDKDAL